MYEVTVITETGIIIPTIPCDEYAEFDNSFLLTKNTEEGEIKEVARFYKVQGYIVKEVLG